MAQYDWSFVIVREELDTSLNELTEKVIGALIAVHEELGPRLPEHFYEKAVCIEFRNRNCTTISTLADPKN